MKIEHQVRLRRFSKYLPSIKDGALQCRVARGVELVDISTGLEEALEDVECSVELPFGAHDLNLRRLARERPVPAIPSAEDRGSDRVM